MRHEHGAALAAMHDTRTAVGMLRRRSGRGSSGGAAHACRLLSAHTRVFQHQEAGTRRAWHGSNAAMVQQGRSTRMKQRRAGQHTVLALTLVAIGTAHSMKRSPGK